MKERIVIQFLIVMVIMIVNSTFGQSGFPILKGPYMGQEPPTSEPKLFAPGIISDGTGNRDFSITSDGKEIYTTVHTPSFSYATILLTKMGENGIWNKPEVVSFDVVTISNSLHHFENPELILNEIIRVLKNDGYLLINEMICDNLSNPQKSHMKFHHWSGGIDKIMGISHNKTYSKKDISDLIKNNINNSSVEKEFNYAFKVENLFDEKLMKQLSGYFDIINKRVESIKDVKIDKKTIIREGRGVKKWIETHGYSPATSVFFVIKK